MDNNQNLNELNEELEVLEVQESQEDEGQVDTEQNKKTAKPEKKKLKSVYRLKMASYASAITALFIAVIIIINVVLGVIGNNTPLRLDLTADNAYTVNPENIEFIKSLDYKVELRVVFTEELYLDGSYASYYQNITDNSGGKYYAQTVELLKQYEKYNKNISVEFVDPYGTEISSIIQEYTDADMSMNYGDILVKCYPDGEDGEIKRGVISFKDCYELEDSTSSYEQYYGEGYESYTLVGNNIEQAVANGIFKAANLSPIDIALITVNSTDGYIENFKEIANENAISFTSCPYIEEYDFSKFDVMMICAPGKDYTEKEIDTIRKWLDNDGKLGKTLMFFGSVASPDMPNLYALLEEWGISVETGYKYYSKDSRYYSTDRTNIYLETTGSSYTETVDALSYDYISNNMLPLSSVFENDTNGNREVETVLQTTDNGVYRKPDNEANWDQTPGTDWGATMMVSKEANEGEASYVVVSSSVDLLTNLHTTTKSDNGNFKLVVNVLNTTSRDTTEKYVMETKVLNDTSGTFTSSTTQAQSTIVAIVFVGVIPLSLIAAAVFVYIKRKNY